MNDFMAKRARLALVTKKQLHQKSLQQYRFVHQPYNSMVLIPVVMPNSAVQGMSHIPH